MVSFKKLFFVGAALFGAASAIPAPSPLNSALSQRNVLSERDNTIVDTVSRSVSGEEGDHLVKRAGRMTLQWSPQGRIFFLLGASFPQAVQDSFYSLGEGGPAKALLDNFHGWISSNQLSHTRAFLLFVGSQKGGVYGKSGTEIAAHDFGFGLATSQFPSAADLQDLLDAIHSWASQAGGLVQVLARPNGFFDPAMIGAGEKRSLEERSRGNTCPSNTNILKYATVDVSDVDINKDIRWAGECDA
ncbi:hypothetical protein F4777DRAFT_401215 [Nemania sp. FL0916]|nr:hypothetical protein F4777DRAFT_401215 [Nemania sp. FL0916]